MADLTHNQLATTGAVFETYFDGIANSNGIADHIENSSNVQGYSLDGIDNDHTSLDGYTLIGYQEIADPEGTDNVKCLAIKDSDGNVYVHFRGTGDGNWDYNTAVYDTEPSKVQTESAAFLEKVIENNAQNGENVYVTGHSQGGNTAQYATLNVAPEYGDRITMTVSLDGPGLSQANVEQCQENPDYYEQQRQKIYAYNGYMDFVSPLGQVQVVPEDHVYMVITSETGILNKKTDIGNRGHAVNFMIEEDGNGGYRLCESRRYIDENNGESNFRKLVVLINEELKTLDQEDQEFGALIAMRLAEHYLGREIIDYQTGDILGYYNVEGKGVTPEQFERFKPLLAEILVKALREDPDLVKGVIAEQLDPNIATVVAPLLRDFNLLPESAQIEVVNALLSLLVLKENGDIKFVVELKDGKVIFNVDLVSIADQSLRKNLPGYAAVSDKLLAVFVQRNIDSWDALKNYIMADPLGNTLDLILALIDDPETLQALLRMYATVSMLILLTVLLMPLIITAVQFAVGVAVVLAKVAFILLVFQIAIEFIRDHWDEIVAAIRAAIDYVEQLARSIYEAVTSAITATVNAMLDTAYRIYRAADTFLEQASEAVAFFAGYVQSTVATAGFIINTLSFGVARSALGVRPTPVRINVSVLSDAVDSMQRLAGRVQAIDERLDTLYEKLCVSDIEESEGIFTSLAHMYHLARADISVDEGGRIRRMASNISGLFNGYADVESWVLSMLF